MHQGIAFSFGHIRIHHAGRCAVVAFHGEIDIAAVVDVSCGLDAVTAIPRRPVVLDLTGVEFIDACGLGLLCRARRRVAARGGRLVLVCDRPRIWRLLRITGLDGAFTVTATLAEALDQAARPTGR
ncbi:STAS domain-containing protein [Streptomyces violascens]|uniref:STAS domain-containing protein n=1 Tax=Streptomyces violascens TaxID=67381 RepID=UPI0036B20F64